MMLSARLKGAVMTRLIEACRLVSELVPTARIVVGPDSACASIT